LSFYGKKKRWFLSLFLAYLILSFFEVEKKPQIEEKEIKTMYFDEIDFFIKNGC